MTVGKLMQMKRSLNEQVLLGGDKTKELKDILLCFLEDNDRGKVNASQSIVDGRYCEYNEEALQDAMACINELFKPK